MREVEEERAKEVERDKWKIRKRPEQEQGTRARRERP